MRSGLLLKVTSTSPSATHSCQQARTISTPAAPSSGLWCRRVHLDRTDGLGALVEAVGTGGGPVVRGVDAVVMGPRRGWRPDYRRAAQPGGVPGAGHADR